MKVRSSTSRLARGLAISVVSGVLVAAGVPTSASAVDDPPGYERVEVPGARLSIAVPPDWEIRSMTRAEAKRVLEQNPQLVAAGATVRQLLATPLTTGADLDGDTYFDRYVTVQIQKSGQVPSPDQIESQLGSIDGIHDVEAKRSTVAKRPALVATFQQEATRDTGAPFVLYSTTYVFSPRSGRVVLLQFYRDDEADADYSTVADTILDSVRLG